MCGSLKRARASVEHPRQTCGLLSDRNQKPVPFVTRHFLMIVENLGGRLDRGDPVQYFLLGCVIKAHLLDLPFSP